MWRLQQRRYARLCQHPLWRPAGRCVPRRLPVVRKQQRRRLLPNGQPSGAGYGPVGTAGAAVHRQRLPVRGGQGRYCVQQHWTAAAAGRHPRGRGNAVFGSCGLNGGLQQRVLRCAGAQRIGSRGHQRRSQDPGQPRHVAHSGPLPAQPRRRRQPVSLPRPSALAKRTGGGRRRCAYLFPSCGFTGT